MCGATFCGPTSALLGATIPIIIDLWTGLPIMLLVAMWLEFWLWSLAMLLYRRLRWWCQVWHGLYAWKRLEYTCSVGNLVHCTCGGWCTANWCKHVSDFCQVYPRCWILWLKVAAKLRVSPTKHWFRVPQKPKKPKNPKKYWFSIVKHNEFGWFFWLFLLFKAPENQKKPKHLL